MAFFQGSAVLDFWRIAMEGRKIQFGRIAVVGLAMLLMSTPAFAQEGGGLDLVDMFEQMGTAAWAVAIILFIMSFWSVGVAIERIYTFNQATKQSKMYAPLVAKHLKEGRLKEAIALSSAKEYRYSHLAKVRSEERRVGKECRSPRSTEQERKKDYAHRT